MKRLTILNQRSIYFRSLMINYLFVILFLLSNSGIAQTKTAGKSTKKLSSVEIQWEENKYATKYQVQVFNSKNKFLRTFESKTSLLKFKSTSGKVKIRGRFLDTYGKYSEWSELIDITVPPEAVDFTVQATSNDGAVIEPAPISAQASNKTMMGKVALKWSEAAQAKKYKITIYDKDKKVVKEIITNKISSAVELEAGTYFFSVTTIGNDDIQGKEVYSPQQILIKSAQVADIPFKLEENKSDKNNFKIIIPNQPNIVITGKLEYSYHLVEKWQTVEEINKVPDFWSPDPKLKPGRYKISFWGKKDGWQDSNTFTHEFVVKPTEESLKEIIN